VCAHGGIATADALACARQRPPQFPLRPYRVGIPIYLVRGDVYYWGSLMAACLIASLPVAVVYNLFLDRFIAGFTVGSVK
jgi:ABC-type glycerol-3-phosphate transport system permease component